jgi:hypothetical protein
MPGGQPNSNDVAGKPFITQAVVDGQDLSTPSGTAVPGLWIKRSNRSISIDQSFGHCRSQLPLSLMA